MEHLRIYNPMISNRVTQSFGVNLACLGVNNQVTGVRWGGHCPDGYEPLYKTMGLEGHNGIDIHALTGEKVFHSGDFKGWIKTEVDLAGGIGVDVISHEPLWFKGTPPTDIKNHVTLKKSDGYAGFLCHVKVRNWHLSSAVGYDGKDVELGQVIGLAGNTGLSSGPHLHWAVKFCNSKGVTLGKSNGYKGAFDHSPYWNRIEFAHHIAEKRGQRPPLTEAEKRNMQLQISLLQKVVLLLRELINRKK